MSRSSPCTFSRFLTSRPTNCPSFSALPFGIQPIAEFRIVLGQPLQGVLDLVLLRLGEGDDADAPAVFPPE